VLLRLDCLLEFAKVVHKLSDVIQLWVELRLLAHERTIMREKVRNLLNTTGMFAGTVGIRQIHQPPNNISDARFSAKSLPEGNLHLPVVILTTDCETPMM
jgi:hypothetical protein